MPAMEHTTYLTGVPEDALRDLQLQISSADSKISVTRDSDEVLLVRRTRVPGWAVLLAIFLFPIGLIALFARETKTGTIVVSTETNEIVKLQLAGDFNMKVQNAIDAVIVARSVASESPETQR